MKHAQCQVFKRLPVMAELQANAHQGSLRVASLALRSSLV